jgi:hypothetical protein
VTGPEVGPLFGMCVARALDRIWQERDEPDPFFVIEAGAGRGRLAREVLRAQPACAPALHYVLVERSSVLQDEQRQLLDLEPADEALGPFARQSADDTPVALAGTGPVFVALGELPALELDGGTARAGRRYEWRWEETRSPRCSCPRPTTTRAR